MLFAKAFAKKKKKLQGTRRTMDLTENVGDILNRPKKS